MSMRPSLLLALPSYLAGHVAKVVQRPLRELLATHGLTLPHYAVLAALADFGPTSQQDLARRLDLDKSHMVKFIDHLERHALVARAPWPADRRRYSISLTSAGAELIAEIDPIARQSQRELLHALSDDEQTQLIQLLERVVRSHDLDRITNGQDAATAPENQPGRSGRSSDSR
jgi:DNA-binding MarR family transcriptional regulator